MRDDNLIFDVGMDCCQDTDFYLAKGFRVVAVDANPAACAAARDRYSREIAAGRLTILNRAIAETSEPLTFYVHTTAAPLSTADKSLRDRQIKRNGAVYEEVQVEGLRPADMVEAYGVPYFAKIDIEGYDLIFLKGFEAAKEKPLYLSTELDFRAYRKQVDYLLSLGYREFALVGQMGAYLEKPPRPARVGLDIDHEFAPYASGLFGPELPVAWESPEQLLARCSRINIQYKASGALYLLQRLGGPVRPFLDQARQDYLPDACDWYDVHARL